MKKYPKYSNAKSGVYFIRNVINGNFYIGSTTCDKRRWYTHQSKLKAGIHDNVRLQRAWDKYGSDALVFEVVIHTNPEMAVEYEDRLLEKFFGRKCCYNLNRLATMPGLGRIWTKEMRIRQSERLRGRRLTEEECKLLRPPLSEKDRQRVRKNNMSKARQVVASMSEEEYDIHLKKRGLAISQSKMDHPVSYETRCKISKSLKGKPWSAARRLSQNKK